MMLMVTLPLVVEAAAAAATGVFDLSCLTWLALGLGNA